MLTSETQTRIMASLPDAFRIENVEYEVFNIWSGNPDPGMLLAEKSVAAVFRVASDVLEDESLSRTVLSEIIYGEESLEYILTERRVAVLAIRVYANDLGDKNAMELVDGYIDRLQHWAAAALPEIIDVQPDARAGDIEVSEIGYVMRELLVSVLYTRTVSEMYPTVGEIETETIVD